MSQIVIQKVGHFEINLWTALWSYGYNQTIFSFVLILTLEQCAFAKKNLVASFNHTDWIEQLQHQSGTTYVVVCSRDKVNYPNIRFRARFFRD